MEPVSFRSGPARGRIATIAAAMLIAAALAGRAGARERPAFEARAGRETAAVAAATWAFDAVLVYVENDEDVNETGAAERWGYLYYSPALGTARAYSIRAGRILTAENLEMKYEAPPVPPQWIDSGAALRAADEGGGRAFRRNFQARVSAMLLSRGAFHDREPDQTTWTVIYASPQGPSLFVMVDAVEGKVRRTWKG